MMGIDYRLGKSRTLELLGRSGEATKVVLSPSSSAFSSLCESGLACSCCGTQSLHWLSNKET